MRKTNNNPRALEKACPFVVPESEIREYVQSLRIHDTGRVAARFQIVADLTKNAVAKLEPSALRRIKKLAGEVKHKRYRRIMEAIILSAGRGSRGVSAAHMTAGLAVQMIFRWSPEYFSALNNYRDGLRKRRVNQARKPGDGS